MYEAALPLARAPRAIEVRASAVARRLVPNLEVPQGNGDKKGDGGTFGPAFSPIIDAPQAPEITAAKPSSPLSTHTADVTTTTRGAGSTTSRYTGD